ncbi:MAG: MFS transporter [Acidobacteria bacterium]|nr:MFS transporter [Acidobacteriota bacterium]
MASTDQEAPDAGDARSGPTDTIDELEIGIEPAGGEEGVVLPWSLMLRRGVADRVERSPRRSWIILAAALSGVFTASFTITVLTVSLADIAANLGSTADVLTWAVTGPSLAMAVLGPIGGKLADRYGARQVYLLSLTGVTVFAGAAILAWNAPSLIAFRFLGAALGAATGPAALAMINRSFVPERRAQAMGYWSMVGSGAPVFGVVIGGPLVDAFGWRWIFILQTPVALVSLIIGFLVLPHTRRGERQPFDIAGSVALAVGVGLLLIGLNRGPVLGWTSPLVLTGFLGGPVMLALFVRIENRTPHPLLPMRYFRRRNFTFPIANQFLANFTYMGGFILTPLLLHDLLGYSTTKVGLVSIARPLTFAVCGPIAGYLVLRFGERLIGMFGSLMLALSMMVLAMIGIGSGLWMIEGALMLSGIGMGACAPAMIATLANAVDVRDLGVASAASQTMSQIGVVAGMQILLTVQLATASSSGSGSYAIAYHVGAVVAVGALIAASFVRRSARTPRSVVVA